MERINRIIAVSHNTFRETIRNRIMLHILGFAVAMLGLAWVVSNWSLGEPTKIITDLGLTITVFAGVVIALFTGIVLVYGELERKTILSVLAKPLPRWEFLIGKFFGFSLAVVLVYLGMNVILLLLLTGMGKAITPQIIIAILISIWEIELVVALAVLFSSFTTPTLSALYTIIIIVAGRFSGDIKFFLHHNPESGARDILQVVYALVPHLSYFNLRKEAVHSLPIGWEMIVWPCLYGVIYCAILLISASLLFKGRDLA